MADPIKMYCSRVSKRLSKRLKPSVAEELTREIEGHLRASFEDCISKGAHETDAYARCLKGIGSDYLVADSLIRAHQGLGAKSSWRIARIPCLILGMFWLVPLSFTHMSIVPDWWSTAIMWLPICFAITFCMAAWRSQRLLLGPTIAVVLLGLIAVSGDVLLLSPKGITRYAKSQRSQIISQLNERYSRQQSELREATDMLKKISWKGSYQPIETAPRLIPIAHSSMGPYLPISVRSPDTYQYSLQPEASPLIVRDLWIKNGNHYIRQIREEAAETQRELKDISTQIKVSDWAEILLRFIPIVFELGLIVLVINGVMVFAYRLRGSLISRWWSPQRLI